LHFSLDAAPVVTPDIEELIADTGEGVEFLGDTTKFTARVSPDLPVQDGSSVDLVIDTAKIHFFDTETGDKIGI
jgi:multiple sugar transport system ATP-binding protein